ncbi:hypothetical protein GGD81_000199 [Rhodobium orientis]|uniref:Nucleoside recognition protein n=1 Tax=Rhodobium orientis TaxID=34017 RepID=A0A327JWU1_9HYPH|nr:nucleoside recognition domain-containing protein [Rhodobium orientis]MBB4301184.1 hypothetical protein [Rhodobium orientis]MBK5951223.1 nucleoside recognition protein [Rhodobium orientis]RAI30046.1 nucleoside recognition protein [Rhodobium orientis]
MAVLDVVRLKTLETLQIYWVLARIMVPVAVLTELLSQLGVIEAVAPAFAPVMALVGLPPELGLAWLTGLLVGVWGAVPLVFALVPAGSLSVADITVFSALLVIAHGLPMEQKIIQKAGPAMLLTTLLRLAGALAYAFLLHRLYAATGWLSVPVAPAWIPMGAPADWSAFAVGLAETMASMLVILLALSFGLEILKRIGLLDLMMAGLAPGLRLAGVRREAGQFAAIGLFLGISYGGGLLIREARSGTVSPRQVFIACVFMGFAHSIIEDTLIVMALGADVGGILLGRLAFAIAATAVVAALVRRMSEKTFYIWACRPAALGTQGG